jgi:hypothetical protein
MPMVFAENAIDLSVFSNLTDQDLEKLGVLLGTAERPVKQWRWRARFNDFGDLGV